MIMLLVLPQNILKYTRGLLWSRHGVMVSTYYKINHKSRENNSLKSFQLYFCMYSLFLYFSTY